MLGREARFRQGISVPRRRSAGAAGCAARVVLVVAEIRASGCISLRVIAEELNARGIPSPGGKSWSSVAVMRLVGSVEGAAPPADEFPAVPSDPAGRSIGGP